MKKTALIVAFCLSAVAPLLADGTNVLTDEKSRLSYAIGMMFANRWKEQGVDVDPDLVLRGLKDGQSGGPTLMSQQDMQTLIATFQKALADRQQKMREELLAKNKAESEAFLAQEQNPARRRDLAGRIAIQSHHRGQRRDARRRRHGDGELSRHIG